MGYSHYWYRPEKLNKDLFKKCVADFNKLLPELNKIGVILANWEGKGSPEINDNIISFNGVANCGHVKQDLGIAWPAEKAGGVGKAETAGTWFAGATLSARCCGGDCSHESFVFEVEEKMPDYQEKDGNDLIFNFCKTAYKPYDLAVNCALIIFKHYFKDTIKVRSDGNNSEWFDGALLCHTVLGYGLNFKLDKGE